MIIAPKIIASEAQISPKRPRVNLSLFPIFLLYWHETFKSTLTYHFCAGARDERR